MGQQHSTTALNSHALMPEPSNALKKRIASNFAMKNYDDAISSSIQLLETLEETDRRKSLKPKLETISNLGNGNRKGTLLAKMLPTIIRPS